MRNSLLLPIVLVTVFSFLVTSCGQEETKQKSVNETKTEISIESEETSEEETIDAGETQTVTINGAEFELSTDTRFFTWEELPSDVVYEREEIKSFTNTDGETHYYEPIYVPSGNLNWYQAAYLAEQAGGYLSSITSDEENEFVFNLVSDEKYFRTFPEWNGDEEQMNHYEIMIGPHLGGYQTIWQLDDPSADWHWLSGEEWTYTNWAVNLDDGVTDQDPRDNTQPNDSGDSIYGQRVNGFGEMNIPVATWGDYSEEHGTYGVEKSGGSAYGFIIEYTEMPEQDYAKSGGDEETLNKNNMQMGPQGGIPTEALVACENKSENESCSFSMDNQNLTGTCASENEGLACRPDMMN